MVGYKAAAAAATTETAQQHQLPLLLLPLLLLPFSELSIVLPLQVHTYNPNKICFYCVYFFLLLLKRRRHTESVADHIKMRNCHMCHVLYDRC